MSGPDADCAMGTGHQVAGFVRYQRILILRIATSRCHRRPLRIGGRWSCSAEGSLWRRVMTIDA